MLSKFSQPLSKDAKKNPRKKSINTFINGGVLLLEFVRNAASYAPVPYLRLAAGLTLGIVEAVQVRVCFLYLGYFVS